MIALPILHFFVSEAASDHLAAGSHSHGVAELFLEERDVHVIIRKPEQVQSTISRDGCLGLK